MSLNQIFKIILSRKKVLAITFFLVVSLAMLVTAFIPKRYISMAVISVDSSDNSQSINLTMPTQVMADKNYLGTQASIISSHIVALNVVNDLKLSEVPQIQESYSKISDNTDGIKDWIADFLLSNVQVDIGANSNTINVSYKSNDPNFSALLANSFVKSYKNMVNQIRIEKASDNELFFKTQLSKLREELEHSQQLLADYQRNNNILVASSDKIDLETQKLVDLTSAIASAQSDYIAAKSQLSSGDLAISSTLNNNPVIQQLTIELATQEQNLRQIGQKEGPNHPDYKQAQAQVSTLKNNIEKLRRQYSSAQTDTVKNLEARLQTLQAALVTQKQKVLDMKTQQTQIDILQRGIDNSQRNYNLLMQKWSESVLQANSSITNVTILQNAIPAFRPTSPNILFNLVFSIIFGLLLGALINYVLDLLNRRVRCTQDVTDTFNLPILIKIDYKK